MWKIILPLIVSVSLIAQPITLADLAFLVQKRDGVSVIFSNDVQKTTMVDFPSGYKEPSYMPLFKSILSANNLSIRGENGIMIVSAHPESQPDQAVSSGSMLYPPLLPPPALSSSGVSGSSVTAQAPIQPINDFKYSFVTHKLDFLQIDSVRPLLDFSGVPYSFSPVSKTITFKETKENKEVLKNLIDEIKSIDQQKDQVTLKITIFDSNAEKIREVGINPDVNFDFSLLSKTGALLTGDAVASFKGSLKLLSQKGAANVTTSTAYLISDGDRLDFKKVVSLPFLDEDFALTTDNGTNQSKKFKYRDVGFKILATPTIVADIVYLDFSLSVGSILSSGDLPTTSENSITNRFCVRKGDIVLLAGISKESLITSDSGTPFLSDLPIIGEIFTQKSKNNSNEFFNVSIEVLGGEHE